MLEHCDCTVRTETFLCNATSNARGAGADVFAYWFLTAFRPGASFRVTEGFDFISDFTPGEDAIQISLTGFGLDPDEIVGFTLGPVAVGPGPQVIFDRFALLGSSTLWFDRDGSGGESAFLLASMGGQPNVQATDVVFVT